MKRSTRRLAAAAAIAIAACSGIVSAQNRPYQAPRLPGTKQPDLNGLWQAINTAHWDIQDHSAQPAPVLAMGAWGATFIFAATGR